jgi:hypothetical protein
MAAPRCDLCDDEDATVHCDGCRYNFCALCSTAVHEDERRRWHAPYAIGAPPPPPAAGAPPGEAGGDREWVTLPPAPGASHAPISPILAHRADVSSHADATTAAWGEATGEVHGAPARLGAPAGARDQGGDVAAAREPEPYPRCPTAGHVCASHRLARAPTAPRVLRAILQTAPPCSPHSACAILAAVVYPAA